MTPRPVFILNNSLQNGLRPRLVFFCFLFALFYCSFPAQGALTITREAESGSLTAPMVIRSHPASSGGKHIEIPAGAGDNLKDATSGGPGQVRFSISVPESGTYFLWARTLAPAGARLKGSFYVIANGARVREWSVPRSKTWEWHKVAKISLSAGLFNLAFRQRHDGTKLDRIILSNDRQFVPDESSDFTIIALPDSQFYSRDKSPIFTEQTKWIVANKDLMNIVYVAQLGDLVDHGNIASEWDFADAAMSLLENPKTTGLRHGIPYGVSVGNHDQVPNANPGGNSTQLYNTYFGAGRFSGRPYYGGHFGSNNDNHFALFSAGGMKFIVIYLEYDSDPDAAVLVWADNLLKTHIDRRAIIVSHYLVETGTPAPFGMQGRDIYEALKGNANLFLMLAGHRHGEGRRTDIFNGNTVHTLLSDYQERENGGDGWLRIMQFSPANNQIRVRTYSPTLNQSESDADSQFTLSYDMTSDLNPAPVTRVGPDKTISLPDSVALDGAVTHDGAVATAWSKVSGPGTVTFGDANAPTTTASFSEAGPYLLQLTADNGAKASSADIMILVNPQNSRLVTLEAEAEDGILTAPIEIGPSAVDSGEDSTRVAADSGSNHNEVTSADSRGVGFSLEVSQGGAYALWARTIAPNGNSDFPYAGNGFLIRRWPVPESSVWKWNKVARVFVGAGMLKFAFRLPNDGVRLDKVILTNDPHFVPN